MASELTIFRGNSMLLTINNMRNSETDVIMVGANVEVTVTDPRENPLAGVVWPIIATEPTPGNYEAEIPGELDAEGIDFGYTLVSIVQVDAKGYIKQGTRFKDRKFEDRGR